MFMFMGFQLHLNILSFNFVISLKTHDFLQGMSQL